MLRKETNGYLQYSVTISLNKSTNQGVYEFLHFARPSNSTVYEIYIILVEYIPAEKKQDHSLNNMVFIGNT